MLENDLDRTPDLNIQSNDLNTNSQEINPTDDNSDNSNENQQNTQNNENEGENKNSEIYGSPENFDYSDVSLPEGMELDKEMVGKFDVIAKELNLSNQSANKLMNLAVELTGKNMADVTNIATELQKAEAQSYEQMLSQDKELNAFSEEEYSQYLTTANLGVKAVATEGFTQLLKTKGLTNHPEFIKTFHNIGKLCENDRVPDARIPAGTERPADILYGSKN